MKLTLNKKKLKNLSKDNKVLPKDMTPQIAGGAREITDVCSAGCESGTCQQSSTC